MDTDKWNCLDKGYHVKNERIKMKINCDYMELAAFSLYIHVAAELMFSYGQIFTHMPRLSRKA